MNKTLLIDDETLRFFTSLNQNVDSKLLRPSILIAQDIHLQRITGTKLYKTLLQVVTDANPPTDPIVTIPEPYATLLEDYVYDFLVWASYYESLEDIFLRTRNNGLFNPNPGESGTSVDFTVYDAKRISAKNKMEYYGERLSGYLCEKEALFPELSESTEIQEQVPDFGTQYKSPIVFKSAGACCDIPPHIKVINSKYKNYPQ